MQVNQRFPTCNRDWSEWTEPARQTEAGNCSNSAWIEKASRDSVDPWLKNSSESVID